MSDGRIDGCLVVGGSAHDFDFVRLELLKLFESHERIRLSVNSNFEDQESLDKASFLVSYTCNVSPSVKAETALEHFVQGGGRWLALHGTNSILEWLPHGVASVNSTPKFFRTLGSEFKAHPPMGAFTVEPAVPSHPLVRGIDAFEVTDELYLSTMRGNPEILMATEFSGEAPGFVESNWTDKSPRPVLYLHTVGKGQVLYYTLGHARGHYDAPHRTPYYPHIERGAWEVPQHYEILRRAIAWAAQLDTTVDGSSGAN